VRDERISTSISVIMQSPNSYFDPRRTQSYTDNQPCGPFDIFSIDDSGKSDTTYCNGVQGETRTRGRCGGHRGRDNAGRSKPRPYKRLNFKNTIQADRRKVPTSRTEGGPPVRNRKSPMSGAPRGGDEIPSGG
jgi:hypothetical protein